MKTISETVAQEAVIFYKEHLNHFPGQNTMANATFWGGLLIGLCEDFCGLPKQDPAVLVDYAYRFSERFCSEHLDDMVPDPDKRWRWRYYLSGMLLRVKGVYHTCSAQHHQWAEFLRNTKTIFLA
ncbi:hypothetical protein [Larkinella soli]|uniref:hypothetical protein n=1 Tax=Larkinella soli TaxID=1770527 RepID=UPI000FFB94F2|nr:hypothetical protein [Larkinella soli]